MLDRILSTPHLARVVPQLRPELLHRIIQTCGLEDCAEIVALATPDQLDRVFDLDLWRATRPGRDEQLDANRFGVWLGVLMEAGPSVAAEKLAAMNVDLVIAALAQHVRVFDRAAVSRRGHDVGNYMIEPRRTDASDAIVAFLLYLDGDHPDYFHRLMRGCRRLSSSTPEPDGFHDLLTDSEQDMFDLTVDRERRHEKHGYVAPAQARAFLQSARQLRPGHTTAPPQDPVARAYFRAIEWTPQNETDGTQGSSETIGTSDPPTALQDSNAIAAVVEVLRDAGVLPQPPRALLDGQRDQAPRLTRIQSHIDFVRTLDGAAYTRRTEELAFLANTLAAGCSLQGRPFTPREASDAAVAVCNLGLENWPTHWLAHHDLTTVFQVGWTVLHAEVCMYAAERLVETLTELRHADREIQHELDALRVEMARHSRDGVPWRARDALDVIVILDMPAWAALLGLIDECPVLHAAIGASRGAPTHAVSASAFEFISENGQIASVHAFMESLPEMLR